MKEIEAKQERCDPSGRAFAGSQRQIQLYVNDQPELLSQAIERAVGQQLALKWVSPLEGYRYRE